MNDAAYAAIRRAFLPGVPGDPSAAVPPARPPCFVWKAMLVLETALPSRRTAAFAVTSDLAHVQGVLPWEREMLRETVYQILAEVARGGRTNGGHHGT